MPLFRQNKNWLRYRTISRIRENNPGLFESGYKYEYRQIKDYLFSSKGWLPIGSIVLISVIISCFIDIKWLNFINISPETAKILVDQRTGNIAAIMSITLVVVGFLISNLAIKDSISYKLLFKDSKLYSIFYYILFLLGFLFVISSLRDTLTPTHFTNLVVYGTYLAIFGLILIGYLFKQIIRFTDDRNVKQLMHDELLIETKEKLKDICLRETSKQIFAEEMDTNNVSKNKSWETDDGSSNSFRFSNNEQDEKKERIPKIVNDINLKKIGNIISNNDKNKFVYAPNVSIGKKISITSNIVWLKGNDLGNSKKEKKLISRNLRLRKPDKSDKYSVRSYFDETFIKVSISNNYHELERMLESYFALYELNLKTGVVGNVIVADVSRMVLVESKRAIVNNSSEILLRLNSFRNNLEFLSLKTNKTDIFNQYIDFPIYLYRYAKKLEKGNTILLEDIFKECTEGTANTYKTTIDSIGYLSENNTIEMQKALNMFYEQAYKSFSSFLFETIRHKDIINFEHAIEAYSQISRTKHREDYLIKAELLNLKLNNKESENNDEIEKRIIEYQIKNKFESLWKHSIVGVKNWLFYLFSKGQITTDGLDKFIKIIEKQIGYQDSSLDEIILFGDLSHNYMGWENWDYVEHISGVMYFLPIPEEWMRLGILVDKIRNNTLYFSRTDIGQRSTKNISYLYDSTKTCLENFNTNFEKWKYILNVESQEDLLKKNETLLADMTRYKRESDRDKSKTIAAAPLSKIKTEKFKTDIGIEWESKTKIRDLFKEVGNFNPIQEINIISKTVGIHTYFEKMKIAFIDGEFHQQIGGLSDLGKKAGKGEDQLFYDTIKDSNYTSVDEKTLSNLLTKATNKLNDKEVIPNLIILPRRLYYSDMSLKENNNFLENKERENESKEIPKIKIGDWNGIPIIESQSQWMNNKILVCNFNSAFTMKAEVNEDWYNKELEVYVRQVSNGEAQNLLDENPNKWKNTEDSNKLTDEEALDLIKTSVVVKIGTKLEFEISDLNSFVIGEIEEQN